MTNPIYNKELTIAACIRPCHIDEITDNLRQLMPQILIKVLRAKYHSLTIDSCLTFTSNDDSLDIDEYTELTLARSEYIVSQCIETCYVSQVQYLQCPNIDLIDQLQNLSLTPKKIDNKKDGYVRLSECQIKICLYYNLDKYEINNIDYDSDDEGITNLISQDPGLLQFPELFHLLSKDTCDSINMTSLPNSNLQSDWERIYLDQNLKQKIYRQCQLNFKISTLNSKYLSHARVMLLAGPPGTGKTFVCKSLAHKLMTELHCSYEKGAILFELNCSRLFSRWFGESSLKISNLFNDIERVLNSIGEKLILFLLIDEVETLVSSRAKLIELNESADGVRVVNTILTHLDKLRKYQNVIVLATSNLVNSIDPAFLDRCDSIFQFDYPSVEIIYQILRSIINDFIDNEIVISDLKIKEYQWANLNIDLDLTNPSCILLKICQNLNEKKKSGRNVSKLAMMALTGLDTDSIGKPITIYLRNLILLL